MSLEKLPDNIRERNVTDLLLRNTEMRPESVGLVAFSKNQGQRSITYRQLWEESACFASALSKRGVEKDDRVGILFNNDGGVECHVTYHASHRLGAINVPLNSRYVARELKEVIELASIKALVFAPEFSETLLKFYKEIPTKIFLEASDNPILGENYFSAIEKESPMSSVELNETDDADWIFTSGTTGTPKAVALTHANSVACGYQSQALWGLKENSVFQNFAPFFTSTGCHTNLLACLTAGCTYFVEPDFEPSETMHRISKYGTTSIFFPSSALELILRRVDLNQIDLGNLKRLIYAGQVMPKSFHERVDEAFRKRHGIECVHLYGLTEGGTCGTMLPPDLHGECVKKITNYGLSVGNQGFNEWIKFKVIKETGEEANPGENGEICFKSPSVMSRYVNEPEATKKALKGGWLHTGDIGTIDEKGFLYFVDRKKQIIRRSGFNISSQEVETVIMEHPAIDEVAVIPKPNPVLGEDVKAVVVLKAGKTTQSEEIIEFCKERLADYKVPREVQFVDKLPRNAMGRIMKAVLLGEKHSLKS